MAELLSRLAPQLDGEAKTWLDAALPRARAGGENAIAELLPQLPRRLGRTPFASGRLVVQDAEVDLGAWRRCDAAAYALLGRPSAPDDLEVELFQHGDLEERAMVLRSLALRPVTHATVQLLGEAQRTNTVSHFEAAVCDSNLAVRALGHPEFGVEPWNRLLLKVAFLDLPLARVFGALEHGNAELTRMLQGLATEREAAGRAVWADTNYLIARAPAPGTLARLIGHLEHGDDRHRLAAAVGCAHLRLPELAPFLRERLARETRPAIRAALEAALRT